MLTSSETSTTIIKPVQPKDKLAGTALINDKKYQTKQIDAMNNLTKSITGLDNTVKKREKENNSITGLVGFRPKIKRQ